MRRQYPQAEPPDPVTCGVYVMVMVVLVVVAAWILLRTAGYL